MGVGAVSYTHLDVYKRQTLNSTSFHVKLGQEAGEIFTPKEYIRQDPELWGGADRVHLVQDDKPGERSGNDADRGVPGGEDDGSGSVLRDGAL